MPAAPEQAEAELDHEQGRVVGPVALDDGLAEHPRRGLVGEAEAPSDTCPREMGPAPRQQDHRGQPRSGRPPGRRRHGGAAPARSPGLRRRAVAAMGRTLPARPDTSAPRYDAAVHTHRGTAVGAAALALALALVPVGPGALAPPAPAGANPTPAPTGTPGPAAAYRSRSTSTPMRSPVPTGPRRPSGGSATTTA